MTTTRRPCPFDLPTGLTSEASVFDKLHSHAGGLAYEANQTDGIGGTERRDDEGIADLLGSAVHVTKLADEALRAAVWAARDHGWSWERIGQQFGATKQAAQKRFGK